MVTALNPGKCKEEKGKRGGGGEERKEWKEWKRRGCEKIFRVRVVVEAHFFEDDHHQQLADRFHICIDGGRGLEKGEI